MDENPQAVHVSPTGENWEVEKETGTIAQAETKEEAIAAAQEAAREIGATEIQVHGSDGTVERTIPAPKLDNPG